MQTLLRPFLAIALVAALPATATAADRRTGVAVMNLRATENIPPELAGMLSGVICEELESRGGMRAVTPNEINQMIGFERQRELVGCMEDTSCLAEIGGALAVELIVAGSVALVDGAYLLQLQLIRVGEVRVDGRVTQDYTGKPAGLIAMTRSATGQLLTQLVSAGGKPAAQVARGEEASGSVPTAAIVGLVGAAVAYGIAGWSYFSASDKADQLSKDAQAYNAQAIRTQADRDAIDDLRGQVGTLEAVSVGALVVGTAALAAGIGLWLSGPDESEPGSSAASASAAAASSWRLGLSPTGIAISGTF